MTGLSVMVKIIRMNSYDTSDGGAGLRLDYAVHSTPFGSVLAVMTATGVCRLDFLDHPPDDAASLVRSCWPGAQLWENQSRIAALIDSLFAVSEGAGQQVVQVHIAGTDFQFDVWQALLKIPSGQRISYSQLAIASGHPGAARAIGNAVGANPVALLIPCHRVVRQDGKPGGYRWGAARKQALLAAESGSESHCND
jgi:AraC family transcriptional regulator, regulatory protein of adaptative response / methylated-DNA-[protein]-cysteine methyltransferase